MCCQITTPHTLSVRVSSCQTRVQSWGCSAVGLWAQQGVLRECRGAVLCCSGGKPSHRDRNTPKPTEKASGGAFCQPSGQRAARTPAGGKCTFRGAPRHTSPPWLPQGWKCRGAQPGPISALRCRSITRALPKIPLPSPALTRLRAVTLPPFQGPARRVPSPGLGAGAGAALPACGRGAACPPRWPAAASSCRPSAPRGRGCAAGAAAGPCPGLGLRAVPCPGLGLRAQGCAMARLPRSEQGESGRGST